MYFRGAAEAHEVVPLLNKHHYLGGRFADPIVCFVLRCGGGLFGDMGEIVAAAVYAAPANRYFGGKAIELVRLVRSPDMNEPLSSFVAWTVRWLKSHRNFDFCVAYADEGEGHHGGIYQALSWKFVNKTNGHYRWRNPLTDERCSNRSFDQRRPEYREGWVREKSAPKFLYIKPLRQRWLTLRNQYGWNEMSYPKPGIEFENGTKVYIEGHETILQHKLDMPGGWRVEPAILDCRYWNEDEMSLSKRSK